MSAYLGQAQATERSRTDHPEDAITQYKAGVGQFNDLGAHLAATFATHSKFDLSKDTSNNAGVSRALYRVHEKPRYDEGSDSEEEDAWLRQLREQEEEEDRKRMETAMDMNSSEVMAFLSKFGNQTKTQEGRDRHLLSAIYDGRRDVALFLLGEGANVRAQDAHGDMSALHWSVERGRRAMATLLLAQDGCDVDAVNKYGRTPFHVACIQGYAGIAHLLLNAGADYEKPEEAVFAKAKLYGEGDAHLDFGEGTAEQQSAELLRAKELGMRATYGAPAKTKARRRLERRMRGRKAVNNTEGNTALHFLALHGADERLADDSKELAEKKALEKLQHRLLLAKKKNAQARQLQRENKAKLREGRDVGGEHETIGKMLFNRNRELPVDRYNAAGFTALMLCARRGCVKMLRFFLRHVRTPLTAIAQRHGGHPH